jgi:hypothetical protein
MSNPIVTVRNSASANVFVDGDPNWDDQELIIDGKPATGIYTLAPGATITVSVDWGQPAAELMMGVIFADTTNYNSGGAFYQESVGQDPSTGNLAITDTNTLGNPNFKYTVGDQAPWSMTINFTNAS